MIENSQPKEWRDAIQSLYEKFGDSQTNIQKINILRSVVGDFHISSTSDWRKPDDEIEARDIACLELHYLESIGLYKPEYY